MLNVFIKLLLVFCVVWPSVSVAQSVANLRYQELVKVIFEQPYADRPTYQVSKKSFGKSGAHPKNHLLAAARRTLVDSRDLLPFASGQKLLQANGICFTGVWEIDQPNDYTGLFQSGASSRAVVRASVALSGVTQKDKRAFGIAVKLLPHDLGDQASLNVFALNSMGGVLTDHTLGLSMDNQPPLGRVPNWRDISTALRMKKDLELADKEQIKMAGLDKKIKPSATFRPVNHLATHQLSGQARSPKWLRFVAETNTRVNQLDFRDELNIDYYPERKIIYKIEVADDTGVKKSKAKWASIGHLELTRSITSKACDTQLHFQHPVQ